MNTIIFTLPQNNQLANSLADKLKVKIGLCEMRNFPDGETYIRIDSDVKDKTIIFVCSLDFPNNKILPNLFMMQTLKDLGAKKICFIAPYLPYMRQDKQFKSGEAVTPHIFAKIISNFIDNLITVDPHLHRITNLSDIYSIPTTIVHAAKPIAEWIKNNVESPVIIGPDEESTQWVAEIAKIINASYVIAKKTRQGDRKVAITIPEIDDINKTPILVDDIISTGTSMCAVIQKLLTQNLKKPICIGIHALFNQEAYQNLIQVGAQEIISCNTVPHPSNKIDVTDVLLEGIQKC
jgi:ribose-phosphate pyrophosphokinase